jgi:hypothetical protein
MPARLSTFPYALLIGDTLALAVVTLVGFVSHGEIDSGARMLTTFLPLWIGWVSAAGLAGLYPPDGVSPPGQLWRPAAVSLLAVPLAAWLRGILLNAPILPTFVTVLTVSTMVSMLIWRSLWLIIQSRRVAHG